MSTFSTTRELTGNKVASIRMMDALLYWMMLLGGLFRRYQILGLVASIGMGAQILGPI